MKVVILAGGLGTRLSEETSIRPKPMVEIGGLPILLHIMKIYSDQGYNDFVICLGYKGYLIKEYFNNYFLHKSDVTINLETNSITVHDTKVEPWKITLVDTGINTMTGGRIRRIQHHINSEPFMLTYGDGVSNVDIEKLLSFHRENKDIVTVTAVQPSGKFGALNIGENDTVNSFIEKPKGDGTWINGGFFVCNSEVFNFIDGDETILEREPLERLAEESELMAFEHNGFWQPMDTLRDKIYLTDLWTSGSPPWKIW